MKHKGLRIRYAEGDADANAPKEQGTRNKDCLPDLRVGAVTSSRRACKDSTATAAKLLAVRSCSSDDANLIVTPLEDLIRPP